MRTIGALIFPGFEVLDVYGPIEMFGMLRDEFELTFVAEQAGPVASSQSLRSVADCAIGERTDFDILFVPGGAGTRREVDNQPVLDWIKTVSDQAEYVLSVCTGSAILARAGVLDGRKATTNKAAFDWVAGFGPKVDWQAQARWVEDGKFITSSGVSAGMDMALATIAKMHGKARADEVAKWAEYEWHQDPSWDPFAKIHNLV